MELELKTSKIICEFPGGVNLVAPVMPAAANGGNDGTGGGNNGTGSDAAAGVGSGSGSGTNAASGASAQATDSMYLEQFPPNGVIDNDWSIHSQFDSKSPSTKYIVSVRCLIFASL